VLLFRRKCFVHYPKQGLAQHLSPLLSRVSKVALETKMPGCIGPRQPHQVVHADYDSSLSGNRVFDTVSKMQCPT
jgi:hypothetical protein